MKKVIYIIPGYRDSKRSYTELIRLIQRSGLKPVYLNIDWRYKIPSHWVDELNRKIKTPAEVLGFSAGAYLAVISDIPFKNIYACSIPPMFPDIIKPFKHGYINSLGKKRIEDCNNFRISSNRCPIKIFVGENELKMMHNAADYVYRCWKGKKEKYILLGASHDISKPSYYRAVFQKICRKA